MGNWWLAASSWQHACSCITSCAEFFGETLNHPGASAPLQPRFGTLWLLAFSKTKITLKGKRFQTVDEIQENITGQLMVIGRIMCVKGTEASLSYVWCFLYIVSSSINVFTFYITCLDTFWTDLMYIFYYIYIYILLYIIYIYIMHFYFIHICIIYLIYNKIYKVYIIKYISLFLYSFIYLWTLCCFCITAIVNNAAMNTGVHLSYQVFFG